jgi:hypothetical protein
MHAFHVQNPDASVKCEQKTVPSLDAKNMHSYHLKIHIDTIRQRIWESRHFSTTYSITWQDDSVTDEIRQIFEQEEYDVEVRFTSEHKHPYFHIKW